MIVCNHLHSDTFLRFAYRIKYLRAIGGVRLVTCAQLCFLHDKEVVYFCKRSKVFFYLFERPWSVDAVTIK